MPWFDLPLDQLREFRTDTAEPSGLDQWWQQRLEAARAAAIPPRLILHEAEIYTPVSDTANPATPRIRATAAAIRRPRPAEAPRP